MSHLSSQQWKLFTEGEVRRVHEPLVPHPTRFRGIFAWMWSARLVPLDSCKKQRRVSEFYLYYFRFHSWGPISDPWAYLFSEGVKVKRPLCSSRFSSVPSPVCSLADGEKTGLESYSTPTSPRTGCETLVKSLQLSEPLGLHL